MGWEKKTYLGNDETRVYQQGLGGQWGTSVWNRRIFDGVLQVVVVYIHLVVLRLCQTLHHDLADDAFFINLENSHKEMMKNRVHRKRLY